MAPPIDPRLGPYFLVPNAVNATQPGEARTRVIREPPADDDRAPAPVSADRNVGLLGNFYKRKNRGNSDTLRLENGHIVDLIECIGDDQVSEQVTITCQLKRAGDITAATLVDMPAVVGFIAWGNDGFQTQAEIDFLQGTQISIAGSFVRFSAAIDLDAPNNGGEVMPAAVVGAHLSYLPPVRPSVYRTRYFALSANGVAGDSVTLPIPAFAHHVQVLRTAAAVLIQLRDRSGALIASVSSIGPIDLPLPNDARSVQVTNLELVASAGRLVFPLWL